MDKSVEIRSIAAMAFNLYVCILYGEGMGKILNLCFFFFFCLIKRNFLFVFLAVSDKNRVYNKNCGTAFWVSFTGNKLIYSLKEKKKLLLMDNY